MPSDDVHGRIGEKIAEDQTSREAEGVRQEANTTANNGEQASASSLAEDSGFAPRRQSRTSSLGPGAYSVVPHFTDDAPPTNLTRSANNTTIGESSTGAAGDEEEAHHVVSAYAVEDDDGNDDVDVETQQEVVQEAKVVNTVCGVDRKRLLCILGVGIFLLAVVLAAVLGTILPESRKRAEASAAAAAAADAEKCGPLCPAVLEVVAEDGEESASESDATGADTTTSRLPPEPERVVFGKTCWKWHLESLDRIKPETKGTDNDNTATCQDVFGAAAYACGCPGTKSVEPPVVGTCGSLCSDGSEPSEEFLDSERIVVDPYNNKIVTDINNRQMTCEQWQIRSQFDADLSECPNYHAIGVLCGCPSNEEEIPPDACGPLCGEENTDAVFPPFEYVYQQKCFEWDVFSRYLPATYGSHGETCDERYRDVARRCMCPNTPIPPAVCGSLCQDRSHCKGLCTDGSAVPDPKRVVWDQSCEAWEFRSRMDTWVDQEELCAYHHMIGAECGCEANEPPPNACGPLCGPGVSPPFPDRKVEGSTCHEWDIHMQYLYEGYGTAMGSIHSRIENCQDFMANKAYGCACPNSPPPPSDGCGPLCEDGSIPDPDRIVGDRSCADFDLTSRFETDPTRCDYLNDIVAPLCGCTDTTTSTKSKCFTKDNLMSSNETYAHLVGQNTYTVTFGPNVGQFLQIQIQRFTFLVGDYYGLGTTNATSHIVSYGGGAPCGMHGPRRGSVVLVEDPTATEPYISNVIEPFICHYQAEMRVPTVCSDI